MPEWLNTAIAADAALPFERLVGRMLLALVLGGAVAAVYRLTHGRAADPAKGLMATLVLLTVLIAMMTLVIGDNVARAFSLVGALAIVRFRTVVEDTRDTAFVIFAVSVGMAVGAGFVMVPLVGIPVAALAAFMFQMPSAGAADMPAEAASFDLTVRVGAGLSATGGGPEEAPIDSAIRAVLDRHADHVHLRRIATARQGAQIEQELRVRLRRGSSPASLLSALQGVDGVQGVEIGAVPRG